MQKIDYTEIVFTLDDPNDIDRASDIANSANTGGIYIEDYRDLEQDVKSIAHIDLIDEELINKDKNLVKIHLYIEISQNSAEVIEYIKMLFENAGIGFSVEKKACYFDDWAHNWKKHFKPTNVGEKITIVPFWEKQTERIDNDRIELFIEPGMAFGTGTHETTRLCLELLEKYVFADSTILDIGCGSGILAIAGVKLGAQKADGVDIDETSVKTAIKNAEINGVSDRFEGICGDLTDKINGRYDVVVANIVADIIMLLNKSAKSYMTEKAIYIVSGIIDTREAEVVDSFEKEGFEILEIKRERGWIAMAVKSK